MIDLPPSLFSHMATPQSARLSLHPPEAEAKLKEYLQKLTEAVNSTTFTPNEGLQAIVFAEWGHGKSQTLYRTADHLERHHPDVLRVTVITAPMDAPGILRAAQRQISEAAPHAITPLEEAKQRLSSLSDETAAMQIVAEALAEAAKASNKLHTAILFDEVQTMAPRTFRTFLEALRDRFNEHGCCLHTLQCHSLSSIDAAQKIAGMLGDWLTGGFNIQLPSIPLDHAYEFYHQRVLDFGESEDLATRLVPSGVAETLCELAGGNPRRMLTLAHQVAYQANLAEMDYFSAETVLGVLERTAGSEPGSRLFLKRRLQAILDLLPQEWNDFGRPVAAWIKAEFPEMFVNRRRYSTMELFGPPLNLNAQDLPRLKQNVDGVPLLSVEQDDELDLTEYMLSETIRERVSAPWGSSGSSLDQKDAQFGLVIQPHRYQRSINAGLIRLLGITGFAPRTKRVPLGTADSGEPLIGHEFLARIKGPGDKALDLFSPVLVTNLFNGVPSESMREALRKGLSKRQWHRVFLFFSHSDYTWDQWLSTSEGEGLVGEEGNRIICLANSAWESMVLPAPTLDGHPESQGVKALRFFSELHAANHMDVASPTEQQQSMARRLKLLVWENHIGIDEVTYLPDSREQTLLSHPIFEAPCTLADLGEHSDSKWTEKLLRPMQGQYLEKTGTKWRRVPVKSCTLYKAILKALKARKGKPVALGSIRLAVEDRLLFPDAQTGRLESALQWVLDLMIDAGLVEKEQSPDGLKYRHRDLDKSNKSKNRELKQAVKKLIGRFKIIEQYNKALSQSIERQASDLKTSVEQRGSGTPLEEQQRIAMLTQDQQQLGVDIENLEKHVKRELDDYAKHLSQSFESCQGKLDRIPESLRDVVLSASVWEQLGRDLQDYVQPIEATLSSGSLVSENVGHCIKDEYKILSQRILAAEDNLTGETSLYPGLRAELIKDLVNRSPDAVRINLAWRKST